MNINNEPVPFLKWAGGKRWLTSGHPHLFPEVFGRYYEPFLGGGAVFFSVRPEKATLSDVNKDLIECYAAIRDEWQTVERLLAKHNKRHCKSYYLEVRSGKPKSNAGRAARLLYLNRTCWNALYRVNLKGEFNVPMGTKTSVLLSTDNFEGVSKLLQAATLENSDFEKIINRARKDDFVFVDPPYTVKHNLNGFIKYNEKMFHWDDQVRLSECLKRANERGCKILLTNANHPSIVDLYQGDFELVPLTRSSIIAASSQNRGLYEELIVRNY